MTIYSKTRSDIYMGVTGNISDLSEQTGIPEKDVALLAIEFAASRRLEEVSLAELAGEMHHIQMKILIGNLVEEADLVRDSVREVAISSTIRSVQHQ